MEIIGVIVLAGVMNGAGAEAGTAIDRSQHEHCALAPAAQRGPGPGPSSLTDEQIRQLLAGEGMGQAAVAERNGYPGPKHVLELADALKLTEDQRVRVTASFERMRADAQELGSQIVQAERALYARFESKTVTASDLDRLTMRVAHLQALLRARHLKAHIETVPVLTAEQVDAYRRLRGHGGH